MLSKGSVQKAYGTSFGSLVRLGAVALLFGGPGVSVKAAVGGIIGYELRNICRIRSHK
ncbi:MAG TPA: hypothetical protein VEH06_02795 [Candidatus Bathyarchaeia archaeon]|nr:hypothetical protein [Candidatus Bathyarchaeia archaeon]